MHPILFTARNGFVLGSYGVIALSAVVIGMCLITRHAAREGIPPIEVWRVATATFAASVFGGRVVGALVDVARGVSPSAILDGTVQSCAVHGCVIGGFTCMWLMLRRTDLPAMRYFDAACPGGALAMGLGRLACLSAGCCFGAPTNAPWGVVFHEPMAARLGGVPLGVALHPVQIYEAALGLVVCGVLCWVAARKPFDGAVACAFLALEGIVRCVTEGWRGDAGRGVWLASGWLSTGRITGVALVLGGLALAWHLRRRPALGSTLFAVARSRSSRAC